MKRYVIRYWLYANGHRARTQAVILASSQEEAELKAQKYTDVYSVREYRHRKARENDI